MLFELADGGVIRHSGGQSSVSEESAYFAHGYTSAAATSADPLTLPRWGCITRAVAGNHRLEILTDHAGAYPLYQAHPPGASIIIGSDAWAVARKAGLTALNIPASFDLLAFEYIPGYETLINGLTEIPPATRLLFTWDGSRWTRSENIEWHFRRQPADAPVSEDAAYENLVDVMRPVAEHLSHTDAPLAVNLSGGWDSRAVIAAARQTGIAPMRACSYGNPEYPGVRIARQVAESLNIPHELFPFSNGKFLIDNFHELCTTMPPTTRFNLADGALAMGRNLYHGCAAVLCGHIGDNMTKLPTAPGVKLNTEQDLTHWLNRHMRSSFRDSLLTKLLKSSSNSISQQINSRLAASVAPVFSPGSAGLFHWKLRNRARRGVIVELRMLERFAPAIYTPMLDKAFIEFWMTVPDSQMHHQQLYRRMLATKLFTGSAAPLARIPRETGTALSPDAPLASLKEAAHNNYHRILRRLSPAAAARQTAADPTALWWQQDPDLRNWAWQQLEESPFVHEHFNLDELRAQVLNPTPSDPSFARIGVWNLLTITGVEKTLCRESSTY